MQSALPANPGLIQFEEALCPRCGSATGRTVATGSDHLHGLRGTFCVTECERCGLWFQNPRPRADQIADLYPGDYQPHRTSEPDAAAPGLRPSRLKYLREFLGYPVADSGPPPRGWRSWRLFDSVRRWSAGVDLVPRFVPGGRLLEVGCGNGDRLVYLKTLGWENVRGIELVESAANRARARGVTVDCGPVERVLDRVAAGTFDAVVASMVLEHLADPFDVVARIARTLKPSGEFLFSTVSRDALDARMYADLWSGFDFPRHLVYFRRRDIARMLEPDFEQVEYFHHAAPIDFVRSARWRCERGDGRAIDRLVVRHGDSRSARAVCAALAWGGLTCRVSCRCRKRRANERGHA